MLRNLVLCLALSAAAAFRAPITAHHGSVNSCAVTMSMGAGPGGSCPNRDKFKQMSRGKVKKLIQESESAELFKEKLLDKYVEKMLLRMNWKLRGAMLRKIKNRGAMYGVDVPADFAAGNVRPRNTRQGLLKPSM